MFLSSDVIERVLKNQLVIDCIRMDLVQQKLDDRVVYSGPGSIYQNGEGKFIIKIYHAFKDSVKHTIESMNRMPDRRFRPGEIIGKEHYYSLQAEGMDGKSWSAINIWVEDKVSFPAVGKVIKTDVKEISCESEVPTKEPSNKSNLYSVIPGNIEFPHNKYTKPVRKHTKTVRVFSLDTLELDLGLLKLNIRDNKDHLTINSSMDSSQNVEPTMGMLHEALGIALGVLLVPVCQVKTGGGKVETTLFSRLNHSVNNLLPPPIAGDDCKVTNFEEFLKSYITSIEKPHDTFHNCWRRLFHSTNTDIMTRALVVTTATEGVLKKLFSKYNKADQEFINQINEAKEIMDDCDFPERAKARIGGSLDMAMAFSVKNCLYGLKKQGYISKEMVETWTSLRNAAAHTHKFIDTENELQKWLDRLHVCLALFYRLLMVQIGYKGNIIDYSLNGWPTVPMPELQPVTLKGGV